MADESRSDGSQDGEHARVVKHHRLRRQLLKSLAAGGVVAGAHVVPDRWVKPVVDRIVVPAHAQASGLRMEARLEFTGFGDSTVVVDGPESGFTVDGATTSADSILVQAIATLIPPPSPGQLVTVNFGVDAGGSDWQFALDASSPVTDPVTGEATFGATIGVTSNFGDTSDLPALALDVEFSSPGVPTIEINVDFG